MQIFQPGTYIWIMDTVGLRPQFTKLEVPKQTNKTITFLEVKLISYSKAQQSETDPQDGASCNVAPRGGFATLGAYARQGT